MAHQLISKSFLSSQRVRAVYRRTIGNGAFRAFTCDGGNGNGNHRSDGKKASPNVAGNGLKKATPLINHMELWKAKLMSVWYGATISADGGGGGGNGGGGTFNIPAGLEFHIWNQVVTRLTTAAAVVGTWLLVRFKFRKPEAVKNSDDEANARYNDFLIKLTEDESVWKFPVPGMEGRHCKVVLDLDCQLAVRADNGKFQHNYKVKVPAQFKGGKADIKDCYLGELYVVVQTNGGSDMTQEDSRTSPSVYASKTYWDSVYATELQNFRVLGLSGSTWLGAETTQNLASWTKKLCADKSRVEEKDLSLLAVLDIGTGNGILLQELSKEGFCDLTGADYSEGAIELARTLALRDGFPEITYMVDDVLVPHIDRQYGLIMDKGTLDVIGMHPDGPISRAKYWDAVWRYLAPKGIVVLTSSNSTKEDLLKEVEMFNMQKDTKTQAVGKKKGSLKYLDEITTYPSLMVEGSVRPLAVTLALLHVSDP